MMNNCWQEDNIDVDTPNASTFMYIDIEEFEPRMMVQLSWKGMQNTSRKFVVEFFKNDGLFPIKYDTSARRAKKSHIFTNFEVAKQFAENKMEEWVKIALEDHLKRTLTAMDKYLPRE